MFSNVPISIRIHQSAISIMKRYFPPETFISKPLRVLAIVHLCVVFSYLLWVGGYPFMGELFSVKSRKLVYERVMKDERYEGISEIEKVGIERGYMELQGSMGTSFWTKLSMSLRIICWELPLFVKLWVVLSVVIPIFILMRIEGAVQAVWLLPVLAGLYAGDNHWYGGDPVVTEEMRLFPSEEKLVNKYLDGQLSNHIFEQEKQLKGAWNRYLVEEWANEEPSSDPIYYSRQRADGDFAFQVARIGAMRRDGLPELGVLFRRKEPLVLYIVYFVWNLLFAVFVNLRIRGQRQGKLSY